MTAVEAMRLVAEDLALEGDPARNLATFVTTWVEPEAPVNRTTANPNQFVARSIARAEEAGIRHGRSRIVCTSRPARRSATSRSPRATSMSTTNASIRVRS
jgi:hypothetical protein